MNAGAFSETPIESELFGHEKGSFEGKAGWFEAADGGTLFLDELGDLPMALQVKLLRVLQEREVTRVGSRSPRAIDVRVIAATNLGLQAAIRAKRFREDLFYRINVASLRLPPLRERRLDIMALATHFISVYERRLGQRGVTLSPGAALRLLQHGWPGNIRELENAIQQALLVHEGKYLANQLDIVQTADFVLVLVNRPRVLLMDEPFCSLDAQTRLQMQNLLLGLWHELHMTVVFVTHDVDEAVFLSERVIVLTRRPARVKSELSVELPRPRTAAALTTLEFMRCKQASLELLELQ